MLSMNEVVCFVPDKRLKIEEIGESLGLNEVEVKVYKKIYGIEEIPTAQGIDPVEFIKKPVQELMEKSNINPLNIKFIIHAHTAKVNVPFGNSIVRKIRQDLKLKNAIYFGTTMNNCASVLVGLDMLNHLLDDKVHDQAIVVCGDIAFTRILQLIPNTSILGDASVAMLVSKQGQKNRLLSLDYQIEGKFSKGIWMENESKFFEKEYANFLSRSILNAIKKSNLLLSDIKLIFPHNVNLVSWQRIAKHLSIPIEKIYLNNIKKYSHCFGADPFINYSKAQQENLLNPGDYYLLATVGLGAVFAAAVFQY